MNVRDLKEYSERLLHITTKGTGLVRFRFNHFQDQLYQEIKRQNKDRGHSRIIVLKARQLGISTFSTAHIFHSAVTNFYRSGMIIAHDADSTRNLFDICKRYYDFLPGIKPQRKRSNARELLFDNPNKDKDRMVGLSSFIKIETAGKKTAGRSATIHDLHVSELAFFENAATILSGLLQSVPIKKGTIVIESTPNGISGDGEEFYNRWRKAESGDSGFTPIFFAAYKNPEYRIPIDESFALTEWEEERLRLFPEMTKEYLNFRRYKIRNDLGSALMEPELIYKQEYADDPTECFISSGRSVFDIDKIHALINRIKEISYETFEV